MSLAPAAACAVVAELPETALSIERLSDILDAPAEVDETNRNNIPMPQLKGAVKYEGFPSAS
jgi:ABC-type bacteriocin/lantibiotic exporter with double-glycine peptidase domain